MTYSSCLSDADQSLVLDASVMINILETGHSLNILSALQRRIYVPEPVIREIENGARADRQQVAILVELLGAQVVHPAPFSGKALELFGELVSGATESSLGDGEAATIALSVEGQWSAVIDEKKAHKVCSLRFPELRLATTVDLLCHDSVRTRLGSNLLAQSVLDALSNARMQVREHQFDWIAGLIGQEEVAKCSSLRRLARGKDIRASIRATG